MCVGKYPPESSVWIAMVSVLAVFDVRKAVGEVDVVPEYTPGVIMYVVHFFFT